MQGLTHEPHYTPEELAIVWGGKKPDGKPGLSTETIRRLFRDEEGVLLIGKPSRRVGRSLKRSYFTMRIPYSVAERVHKRLASR